MRLQVVKLFKRLQLRLNPFFHSYYIIGPEGNSLILFPENLDISQGRAEENITKLTGFPRDQSLSDLLCSAMKTQENGSGWSTFALNSIQI